MADMEAQTQAVKERESPAIFKKANRLVSLKVFFLIYLSVLHCMHALLKNKYSNIKRALLINLVKNNLLFFPNRVGH